jgi:hypothetical protein
VIVLVLALLCHAPLVRAQAATTIDSITLARCAVDDCALALQPRWYGVPRVSEGLNRRSFSVGLTGGALAWRVRADPDAFREANIGRRHQTLGALGFLAGVATLYFSLNRTPGFDLSGTNSKKQIYLGLAGAVTTGMSIYELSSARTSYSRAILLYNSRFSFPR